MSLIELHREEEKKKISVLTIFLEILLFFAPSPFINDLIIGIAELSTIAGNNSSIPYIWKRSWHYSS
jgi:hypothetical protein